MAVRRTLQQSLALNFALVALVPLLLLVVAALYRLSLVNDEVSARNRGLARAVSSQAALFLNGPRTTLEQLRHWLQVLGADDLRLQSILDAEAESSALFEVFYLLDEDDRVAQVGLPSAQRPLRSNYLGLDLSGRHFVTRSRESGLPQWSDTFLSVISGQISLALAVPVNGRVLVGDFSIQRLSRFLDELELERRILPLILDHMGNIIAHPSAQFSAQQINLANQALVKQALGGDPMTGPFDFAGERYIGTVVPVSASDWLTLVGERTETAYRESRSIIGILLGAMVLAIALALGVAIILARRLVWPIRVFSERAARFGAGDYEADMPRAPVRELDRLAQAFSDMRSAVQDREQRLAESERQYRRLVEGTDNLITRVDTEGRFTFVNSTAETVYGVPAPQCIGRSAFDFIHPEDRERTRRAFLGWLRGTRDRYSFQNRQIGEHGETRDMLWTISVDRNVEGVVVGLDSIARDITELKRTESTLRQQRAVIEKFAREEQVLLSLSRLSLGVLPLEAFLQRCITCLTTEARWLKLESRGAVLLRQHANRVPAVAATVGLESGLPDGIIGPYRKESTDAGRLCKDSDHWSIPLSSGEAGFGRLLLFPSPSSPLQASDDIFLERASDLIAQGILRRLAESEIEHQAHYDALTGLPNRRLLLDRIEVELARTRRNRCFGALLFLDLDNFKTLNDAMGHAMGDLLLQQVADRLRARIRGEDMVARLGGDEFVLLLSLVGNTPAECANDAQVVAESVCETLSLPFELRDHVHQISVSIGIAIFPSDDLQASDILRHADAALYEAKASGRNTIRFFRKSMQQAVDARLRLGQELRAAIEREEFVLYFHPRVDAGGDVIGAEALIRWNHPCRGIMLPGEFVPMAEDSGIILPIGDWVLRAGCRQLALWQDTEWAGVIGRLALNVSPWQFQQKDFARRMGEIIEQSGADPSRLVLEITERILVDNIEDAIGKIRALKAIGVGFAIDDFGTGYSSLRYLQRLPLDELKIDQSFVRELDRTDNDAVIVDTIIAMAARMSLEVIAEGVETVGQLRYLQARGCRAFQGFYFTHPLPLEEFEHYCRGNRAVAGRSEQRR